MLWIYGLLLLLNPLWTQGLGPGPGSDPGPGSGPGPGTVFVSQQKASVLLRSRRANSGFLEELKKGNLERECVEEICDYEEAREVFEDKTKTDLFWTKYVDGDSCESSPCLNEGVCKDTVGGFNCFCKNGFQGSACEIVTPELCDHQNGGCHHFCAVESASVKCSCADGYFLSADEQTCESHEPFKCGVLVTSETRTIHRYDRNKTLNQNQTTDGNLDFYQDLVEELEQDLYQDLDPELHLNQTETQTWVNHTLQELVENSTDSQSHQGPASGQVQIQDFGPENPDLALVQEELVTFQTAAKTRIVNGEDCPLGECPWQALLLNEEHRGFCGGTLLTDSIVLTAAHCMNQSRHIYVVLGEFDTQVRHGQELVRQVEKVLLHHKYRSDTYHNDIALIQLKRPATFSRYILPACLPTRDLAEKVLMKQSDGLVSGFGRLGEFSRPSSIIQRLAMPYVERARCLESTQFRISGHMFCAGYEGGGRDACQGDSGGPHVTSYESTYYITGVVSWGEGCARKGKYGVYTQVSKYIGWIRSGIRALKQGRSAPRRTREVFGPDPDPRGFKLMYL